MYILASKYNKPPSEIIDELGELPPIARYLVNRAVTYFGMTIENALRETDNIGSLEKPRTRPRYTLKQLLDKDFRLPRPGSEEESAEMETLAHIDGGYYDEVS